eukprot:1158039-Pelagomonas_calceolata.AAC.18
MVDGALDETLKKAGDTSKGALCAQVCHGHCMAGEQELENILGCAAVIAWLESMADDALNGGPGANSAHGQPRFAEHEGVWLETKHRLGQ